MIAAQFCFVVLVIDQCLGMGFTPLEIDNHPCTPENLKRTNRYICDSDGNVICQSGWREPIDRDDRDDLNPCTEPICDHNGQGCLHGECRSPDYCACEVGWEGANCETCVPLPGCDHGTCEHALECNCDDGFSGAYCDIRKIILHHTFCDNQKYGLEILFLADCNDCVNGRCLTPNDCM
jgi:hypothetical protein